MKPQRTHSAFTLVEALFCVLVVAILLSILLTALAAARRSGTAVRCLTNARECGLAIFAYAADNRDSFPYLATSPNEDPAFYNAGIGLPYDSQSLHWPMAASRYLCEASVCETQLCPANPAAREFFHSNTDSLDTGYPSSYVMPSDYWLSYTLFSDPRRWRPGADPADPSLKRAVRLSEVATPSQKGMLIEVRAYHLPGDPYGAAASISLLEPEGADKAFSTVMADGHARQIRRSVFLPGFNRNGDAVPVLMTTNGALGQDLPR